jgi:hypothetical protein
MKAGMALEEALNDVGEIVGVNEVRNAFMFLGQCAKHGGEISRQLQELSESVTLARQLQIEAKITALQQKLLEHLRLFLLVFWNVTRGSACEIVRRNVIRCSSMVLLMSCVLSKWIFNGFSKNTRIYTN